ncbi:hypothetical protein JTE90_009063 [Oedothorax gibbosus]|uniref:ACB domain-containing protein n=1 Tax=Oedothorax gibbosus TaxID=931172 RepID=A0AAV6V260_9ARAC|nr:hypothetical protein JTE90_009063 [Oedothorax gibbosus]
MLLTGFRRTVFSSRRLLQTYTKLHPLQPAKVFVFEACRMGSSFQEATKKVKTLKEEPGNDVKLKLYALFKQSTEGSCKQPKPGMFDMIGKAKWDAWNALGSMSQEDAQKKYAALVDELSAETEQTEAGGTKEASKYEGISFTVAPHITEIAFNRPAKKNAITTKMYGDIILALKEAAQNDTALTVITGKGDYYSSGNDLSNFSQASGDLSAAAVKAAELLKEFVAAFIDHSKVLVAAVNGPAVGIPVTLLGLCDVVYASDTATFQTPFSLLGQSPEGCSSYTFPKIMGYSKANEILLFNKKLNATEAKELGLVSEVFPFNTFHQNVQEKLAFLSEASKQSLIYSKELSRGLEKPILHQINDLECKRLIERWQSPDCMEALMRFFTRKSKL